MSAYQPRRGDDVELWLHAWWRAEVVESGPAQDRIERMLLAYRLHADMGTPLDRTFHNGGHEDEAPGEPAPASVVEYGGLMSGGGVNVWPDDPELLDIYPLAKRIEHGKRHGGHVMRRRVIVIDDWEEL